MFRAPLVVAFVLVAIPSTVLGQARAGAAGGLQGVWRIVEGSFTGPTARTDRNPLPGFYIFTARHYSLTREDSTRANLPAAADMTVEQLRNRLMFSAQAGTYQVTGSEVRLTRVLALAPSNMQPGNFALNTFRIQGDTLWMTTRSNQEGPVVNPTTYKLVRVE